jgi:hypothetical protein
MKSVICLLSDRKKNVLLPLLFSYGGIAKTVISTDFDTCMVFKICSYVDEKRTFRGTKHFTSQRCKIFFLTANLFASLAESDLKNLIIKIKTESSRHFKTA